MSHENLKQRTKLFALAVIRLVKVLPDDKVGRTLGLQLLRSATSVAANYRAANRARSNADFIAKMGIVEEEADESVLWLDLLTESGITTAAQTKALLQEASELTAITVASINTARKHPLTKTPALAPSSPLSPSLSFGPAPQPERTGAPFRPSVPRSALRAPRSEALLK